MPEVLSVTHYIQDVIEKTEANAVTTKAHTTSDKSYHRPIDTLVIQPHVPSEAGLEKDVKELTVADVHYILNKKVQLIIQIRQLQYSSDIETVARFLAPIVDNFKKLEKAYNVSLQEYKRNISAGKQKYDGKVLLRG